MDDITKHAFLIGVELGYKECERGKNFQATMQDAEKTWLFFSIFEAGLKFFLSLSR